MTTAVEDVKDQLQSDWDSSNTSGVTPDVIRYAEEKRVRTPKKNAVQVRIQASDPADRRYAGISAAERNTTEYVDVDVVARDDTLADDAIDEVVRVFDQYRRNGFSDYDRVDSNAPQSDLSPDRTKIYKLRQRIRLYKDAKTITV